MNNQLLILIIEDDETISNFISAILTANGYRVVKTRKGSQGVAMAASHSPDLVLLDLGLPDMDGVEVLKLLRAWSAIPVVVVSARGHERDKVEALDLGANDYITKPFGTAELLARIRNAIRLTQRVEKGVRQEDVITVGELKIDLEKRSITLSGKDLHFTPVEYKIIVLLARNIGKVLTHDMIMREVWGPYTNEIQALRVNMANIRRKLEVNPAEPKYIVTEVGVGYRMMDEI